MTEFRDLPLEAFPAHVQVPLRFNDIDGVGHVNNAVFATLFGQGRVELFYNRSKPWIPETATVVLARLIIDYHAEVTFPGTVDIATGVARIGRTSFTVVQAMFNKGLRVASSETINVLMDKASRKAIPLEDSSIRYLTKLTLPVA